MESQLSTANKIQFLQAPALAGSRPITEVNASRARLVLGRAGDLLGTPGAQCWHSSMTLVLLLRLYERYISNICRQRPYHVESIGSRPITEVKQRRARLVLGWVTAWEHPVLLAYFFFLFFFSPPPPPPPGLPSRISVGFVVDPNVMMIFLVDFCCCCC